MRADTSVAAENFRGLFEVNWGPVLRYARRRVNESSASDVASDVFVVAWRRREELPADVLPWLYGVARRVIANHRRSEQRSGRLLERIGAASVVGDERARPIDPAETVASAIDVAAAFAKLSEDDRELLALMVWEGLDARRTAAALGCSAGAVTMRLTRARRRLRALLSETEL